MGGIIKIGVGAHSSLHMVFSCEEFPVPKKSFDHTRSDGAPDAVTDIFAWIGHQVKATHGKITKCAVYFILTDIIFCNLTVG